jgi:hypothetical protein
MFPYPYMHLTHRKVLVESFHEGLSISNYLEHDDAVLQRKLAKIGIATILKMVNESKNDFYYPYYILISIKILKLHVYVILKRSDLV